MKQLLTLILHFLKKPTEESIDNQSVSAKVKWLFLILLIDIPLMFGMGALQAIPERLGFIDASQHKLIELFDRGNLALLVFSVILFAPFLEELIIRLPLRIKRNNFIPFIFIGILLNGTSIVIRLNNGFSWLIIIPVTIAIIVSLLVFNGTLFKKISNPIKSQYGFYFYLISIIFALLHLFNYQFNWYLLLFAPLLVLPQFVGGLLMGFIRIKSGFKWGVFLHMLHNALFLLPFYFYMNNTNQKIIGNIKTEGFQFELVEGKSSQKEIASISKITPDEIILYGTFEKVIGKLTHKNVKEIKFENSLLAKKKINISFKNDSAYTSPKTDSACHYALHNLLNNYKLQLKTEKRWTSSFTLSVKDNEHFQRVVSDPTTEETASKIRSFFGKRDTIKVHNINSKYVKHLLEINLKVNITNEIDEDKLFSINVPNTTPSKLNKYFKENYGIELKQKRAKVNFLIVEKR